MRNSKKNEEYSERFEIEFYESILQTTPDFIEVLIALGDLYTKIGEFEKGLSIDQRLAALRPDDPIILYNLACSYSLVKDCDRALNAIECAFRFGYDDMDHLERDQDLANLKADDRFRALMNAHSSS